MESTDWNRIFFNEFTLSYGMEIIIRTFVMFFFILLVLRMAGKRGVRQLSLFEVAIIISLGSAAGDPMFTENMAIIPALVVFFTIILLYRFVTWLTAKRASFEKIIEGEPIYIVENGVLVIEDIPKNSLAKDEFFSELRQCSVEHLGQVRTAILETNGNISVYYYPDSDVRPGLPILPKAYEHHSPHVPSAGLYACIYCGKVEEIMHTGNHTCPRCEHKEWVAASNMARIT